MKAPHHPGDDVRFGRMEVVVDPEQIRRHRRDEVLAVLPSVHLAQFQAGNLGNGVAFVCRLERCGQQTVLRDRLGRKLRIDTRASQEQELLDTVLGGRVNHVGCEYQILVEKIGLARGVRMDSSHSCCRVEHVIDFLFLEESVHGSLIEEVEFRPVTCDEIVMPARVQFPNDRGADETAVTRDEDSSVFIHAFSKSKPPV